MIRIVSLALLLACLGACRGKPLPEPVELLLPRAESGTPFSFASKRGDVLIVYFFATWCIPCQAMDPSVAQAAIQGAADGIDVVGVALDVEGRRTVEPYVRAVQPPYPVVVGGGSVAQGQSPFGRIPELPSVLFLDREGRPAASISGVASAAMLLERARDVSSR